MARPASSRWPTDGGHRSWAARTNAGRRFECAILDGAHRARRRNIAADTAFRHPVPNQLLAFIRTISPCTKSLLLATATPVQPHPIEAYDLLDALAQGSDQTGENGANLHLEPDHG